MAELLYVFIVFAETLGIRRGPLSLSLNIQFCTKKRPSVGRFSIQNQLNFCVLIICNNNFR